MRLINEIAKALYYFTLLNFIFSPIIPATINIDPGIDQTKPVTSEYANKPINIKIAPNIMTK